LFQGGDGDNRIVKPYFQDIVYAVDAGPDCTTAFVSVCLFIFLRCQSERISTYSAHRF